MIRQFLAMIFFLFIVHNDAVSNLPYTETSYIFDDGNKIIRRHYNTLSSTHETIKDHLEDVSLSQWIVISTGEQEGGRDIWGRPWVSLPGNVFVSYAIPLPKANSSAIPFSPIIAGVALLDTLKDYNLQAQLRWPNTALIDGERIGGILCNAELRQEVCVLMVGIGMNVSMSRDICDGIAQPTTSFLCKLSQVPPVDDVIEHLTKHVYQRFHSPREENIFNIFQEYKNALCCINEEVKVFDGENTYKGVFKGVNHYGHLILEMPSGTKAFFTGEIIPKVTQGPSSLSTRKYTS